MEGLCGICSESNDTCSCFCDACGEPDCNEACVRHEVEEAETPLDADDQEAFDHAMDKND